MKTFYCFWYAIILIVILGVQDVGLGADAYSRQFHKGLPLQSLGARHKVLYEELITVYIGLFGI